MDARTGAIVDVNPYLIRLLGCRRTELVKKKLWKVPAFKELENRSVVLRDLQANEHIHCNNLQLRTEAGRVIEAEFTSSHCEMNDRSLIECSLRRITIRPGSSQAVAASEAELRTLFASMHDVVLVIDGDGLYRSVAPTDPGLLYQPANELLRKNLRDVFPPEQAQALLGTVRHVLSTRQTAEVEYELPIGGRPTWFASSISPMDAESTLWVARDITAHKRAEHQLGERAKELQALYGLAQLIERDGISLNELYQETANILPKSWQYPEIACARIVVGESEYRTENFASSTWTQSAPVVVRGSAIGKVEVGYLEERPEEGEGPFLKEERDLINAIAERLARVTQRKQAEEALRIADANYRSLFENATVGIFQSTPQGRFLSVNPTTASIFGYQSPQEMLAHIKSIEEQIYLDPASRGEFRRLIVEQGQVRDFTYQARRRDGSIIWVHENARVVTGADGSVLYYEGFMTDITDRKQAQDELRRAKDALEITNLELQRSLAREEALARTDGLTGLCNRIYFDELATREFQAAARYERALAIMMIDIDNFKRVNDTFGHAAGDEALIMIGRAAAAHTRGADVIARLGGDEFILLFPETPAQQALPIADRIVASVAAMPIGDPGHALNVTLSAGIAELRRSPMDTDVEQVVQRADQALYRAKADGRNCTRIFDSGTEHAAGAGKGQDVR